MAAKRTRDRLGARPAATQKEKTGDIPTTPHEFTQRMEREMDEPLESVLRNIQRRLTQVLNDPDVSENALAGIAKTLVMVTKELEQAQQNDQLTSLLDDVEDGVDDDVGAQII